MKRAFVKKRGGNTKKPEPDLTMIDDGDEDSIEIDIPSSYSSGVATSIEQQHTNISDIIKSDNSFVTFYNKNTQFVTIYDFVSLKEYPSKTSKKCFWCKNKFTTSPLGCPIEVLDNELIETWKNSDNTFVQKKCLEMSKEDISEYEKSIKMMFTTLVNMKGKISREVKVKLGRHYIAIKIFCSFNCVQAFIEDERNKGNHMVDQSTFLLTNVYKDIHGKYPKDPIIPAHHWSLLDEYEGRIPIEEFRKSFLTVKYVNTGNLFYPVGEIYREEIVF